MSFVSSKSNILCRLINIELYKIFAIMNRAIKGLHCTCVKSGGCSNLSYKTSGDWTQSFWGTFSHPPTPKWSFGVLKLLIVTEFDPLGPKFHFSLHLIGSNFHQQPAAHTLISFRTEYPWSRRGNMSTPTCDVTMHKMVVPYSSNVCENSLVQFSAANLALAGFPLTNALGESMPSHH